MPGRFRRGRGAGAIVAAVAAVALGVAAAVSGSERIALFGTRALALFGTRALVIAASLGPDRLSALLATLLGIDSAPSPSLPPSPTEPDGPILVITAAGNPFSTYLAEILRAEGLNEFSTLDVGRLTPAALAAREVVLVGGDVPLAAAPVAMLSAWTAAGGTLIAMHPDPRLAPLLGLASVAGTLADGYLRVDTAAGPGRGIVGATMQFHGSADQWTHGGDVAVLATLFADGETPTRFPAVTQHAVGVRGGLAVAFAYDLARSVVYTRQGNPVWAGQPRHGPPPRRAVDLFSANARADAARDWLDLAKLAIPQADEQQRLLANIILQRRPLPRFWYLPKGVNAAVVMTGDDHGDGGMRPRFDRYRDADPPECSVADWECVRATGYLYVGNAFTAADAERYTGLGFEVALHADTKCRDWSPASLAFVVGLQLRQFAAAFPGIPAPATTRTHCAAWSDWSTQPEIEAAHGIRLDTNYYFYPASWTEGRAGWFTGSGFPMRFAARDGRVIDCYQAATQITDESAMDVPAVCDALLDRAVGAEGFYGVVTVNMHFDVRDHPGSNAIVASARAHGVPVISARQLLEWIDGRNASSFRAVTRGEATLGFTVAVGSGARNLRVMVPARSAAGSLAEIARDGVPVPYDVRTVKGIEYAFCAADAGSYVARYTIDE